VVTPRLLRLSAADVTALVRRSLPEVMAGEPEAVAWVPRGGSIPAALLAQWTGLPMVPAEPAACAGLRTLLVEDLCVTGAALLRVRDRLAGAASVTTYGLVRAGINTAAPPDHWGLFARTDQYVMLPWEVTDMFDDDFPFAVVAEVDGVLRDPGTGRRLLRADRVPRAATTPGAADADRAWARAAGVRVDEWLVLGSDPPPAPGPRPGLYLCGDGPDARHREEIRSSFDIVFPLSEGDQEGRGYDRYTGTEER
jgi:hypothetical protein